MSENLDTAKLNAGDDEIDLRELFSAIWQGKWIIIATTFVFAVASVFYALSLPNIYKSEALLGPVNAEAGMRLPGQLGGLAALAGVNVGANASSKTTLAIEILKSRDFIGRFIEKYDLYVPIIAAQGWDSVSDNLNIDSRIYNTSTSEWVRKGKKPLSTKPSPQETYNEFMKILDVSQDTNSGLIKISIIYYSPKIAKIWVDKMIKEINDEMRRRDISEAEKSINYLNEQVSRTNISDMRTMLYTLIEDQIKNLMLANVRDEYVFETIDPSVIPEEKFKPKRAFMVILYTMFGFFCSVFLVFFKKIIYLKRSNKNK